MQLRTSWILIVTTSVALPVGTFIARAQDYIPMQTASPLGDSTRALAAGERGPDGSTPLQWAVYDGDVERVRELIAAGADVNASNAYGANAMQLAAETADIAMLRILLDAGADVDSPNPESQTTLMLVARTGIVEAAELLVEHSASIDTRETWGGQTALMWAAARRQPAMVEYLITQGADIDAQSIDRDYRRHLTKEGRAKSLDSGGLTPVLYSIRENCFECLELLIDAGADLDQTDPDGVSPLLLAVTNSRWDMAVRLVHAGADIQQWDRFGQSPLFAAISLRNNDGRTPFDPPNQADGLSVITMLLERGADPDIPLFLRPAKSRGGSFSRGTTPLIAAAGNGDLDVIKLLLEHGASANRPQADLQTPVSALAGARGDEASLLEGLALLVEAGADVNVVAVHHHLQRTRGGSPLHYAARAGNAAMIEALVAHGADVNIRDYDGLTALDYAMQRGFLGFQGSRRPPNTRLAELLRSLGATEELASTPHWPNVGPPFYYPWNIFPLDPEAERAALVPGSFDHQ